jgi:hypothetical protein
MKHSLFKYFPERRWAEAFLDGQVLFRSLSYFQDYEDKDVRGDNGEGTARFRPAGGLVVNNLTHGTTFTLQGHAFESAAKQDEVFVFCVTATARYFHLMLVLLVLTLDRGVIERAIRRAWRAGNNEPL